MAKDITANLTPDLPTRKVVSAVHIHALLPLVEYTCRGMVPTGETNELGEQVYRDAVPTFEYTRSVSDPALLTELMGEAAYRIVAAALAVMQISKTPAQIRQIVETMAATPQTDTDFYSALEATAQHLEDRLTAGEALPVQTINVSGAEVMAAAGIPGA